jgi:hypothetical protein
VRTWIRRLLTVLVVAALVAVTSLAWLGGSTLPWSPTPIEPPE